MSTLLLRIDTFSQNCDHSTKQIYIFWNHNIKTYILTVHLPVAPLSVVYVIRINTCIAQVTNTGHLDLVKRSVTVTDIVMLKLMVRYSI
jgi:hypothetical protein